MSRWPRVAGAAAVALVSAADGGIARESASATAAPQRAPPVAFSDRARDRLVISTPAYRLTVDKRHGGIRALDNRAASKRLVTGSVGCLWGAVARASTAYIGGCSFAGGARGGFRYHWDRRSATLTLTYRGRRASQRVEGVVRIRAARSHFDMSATVHNRRAPTLERIVFPADLVGRTATVTAGYAPNFLPGVRFDQRFFTRVGSNVNTYPSRWAFADYLALDVGDSHVAVYSANPPPHRLHPVTLGFVHNASPKPCSGQSFCVVHAFETWLRRGETWRSPVVRIRIGGSAAESIRAYRVDNGIHRYPSLQRKLGARLAAVARAPLVKADLWKGLPPFREWARDLRRLPAPALLHPVSYQPRGHDESFPDFLPPDPVWGTTAELRAAIDEARALGLLVMPYLNVSWWDDESPTMRALPRGLTARDVSVLDERGAPVVHRYVDRAGYVISPFVPFVRERIARLLEQWRSEVPVDCVFFDQIGARPWLRDFNAASPTPLAYHDGWLETMAPYAGRCLMVEDGWDRLAASFSAFHGSLLMLAREFDEPNRLWGAGTWEPYPLAVWLLHDKVLLYQHDLFEGTMATDLEVLSWNMAFGLVSSYNWDGWTRSIESPWLELVGMLQRTLGPRYAGIPLAAYRDVGHGATASVFGDLVVRANWSDERTHEHEGYGIPPKGFFARTTDGGVVAGAFAGSFGGAPLEPGVHYLIVERRNDAVEVRQPLGADTPVAVVPPSRWRPGETLRVVALGDDDEPLGEVEGELRRGRFVFRYLRTLDGRRVTGYRVEFR